MRDGIKHYAKKASLLWALTVEGKRVSTDRIFRFVGSHNKFKNDEKLLLGEFVMMNFNGKHQLVQILGFRFVDGKTFHGDFYLLNRKDDESELNDTSREVCALCHFFNIDDNNVVIAVNHAARLINLKLFIRRVFFKREISSGEMKIVQ